MAAKNQSFDVQSICDAQEIDNALNQALKELTQRFDFRGVTFTLEFQRKENQILIEAPEAYKLNAIWDVLQTKLIKRAVPIKNFERKDPEKAGGDNLRQTVLVQQGIPGEKAKEIVKFLKEQKLKNVQSSIQADQVRIASPSRDALQDVMALLRKQDFGIDLQFGNFRSQ